MLPSTDILISQTQRLISKQNLVSSLDCLGALRFTVVDDVCRNWRSMYFCGIRIPHFVVIITADVSNCGHICTAISTHAI